VAAVRFGGSHIGPERKAAVWAPLLTGAGIKKGVARLWEDGSATAGRMAFKL
jgi:hypothetical protein